VFALLHTAMLTSGRAPVLALTRVRTETYSQPPNAIQKPGQLHVGSPEGRLQTDFNAVQEVTYAHDLLYAKLSTGFDYRSRPHAAVAWFTLRPHAAAGSVTAGLVSQGYVRTTQSLLYPVIGVNGHGRGYLATEYVAPVPRTRLGNWATRIWSASVPAPAR
jgi:hypothetical protein